MKKLLILLFTLNSFALEIDEKLTLRFLDVSKSQKTILVNRGLEDGLVVGDHAKFFITEGVIARGVVVKASPSRSIWSIYRIVRPTSLTKNNVVNLKISTAVKITKDQSKSIKGLVVKKDFGEPADISTSKAMRDNREVRSLFVDDEGPEVQIQSNARSFELWTLVSMSSLSGNYTKTDSTVDATSSNYTFSGGVEKFFPTYSGIFKKVSLKAFASMNNSSAGNGVNNIASWMDFGLGANYYLGKGPFRTNTPAYFLSFNGGVSKITLETQDNVNPSSTNTSGTLEGGGTFVSVGFGAKYMLSNSFGGHGLAEYYIGKSSFDVDNNSEISTENLALSGPRVMFGLFYRF